MDTRPLFGALLPALAIAGCADLLGFDEYSAGTGGAGAGGAGTGGAGSTCEPLETRACYSGAQGTSGVGICHAGIEVCAADGRGWGACSGEVTPKSEDCATTVDDDCDGTVNEADAGCGCVPGATISCYDGPIGTLGVGLCVAGKRTCDAAGLLLGPCVSQVKPEVERCDTDQDESCDGASTCTGAYRWARRFGDASGQFGNGVAVDAAGNVILVGRNFASIDFGGGPLVSSSNDVVVAKLDPRGKHLFSHVHGDAALQVAYGVAVDSAGNILVVGEAQGTTNFGGSALVSGGGHDAFVVKLDPAGNHVWSKLLGGALDQAALAVAVGPQDAVIVAGRYLGAVNFGGQDLPTASVENNAFVVELDALGNHVWSKGFDGTDLTKDQIATAVAVDAAGDVVVGGTFEGSIDFGGGTSFTAAGLHDVFVAKLAGGSGAVTWAHGFGGASDQALTGIAVDDAKNVLVAGWYSASIDFGAGLPGASKGGRDIFLTKLDGAGATLLAKGFGGVNDDIAAGVAVDAAGHVVLVGSTTGTLSFGGGSLVNLGNNTAVAAKLDGNGAHLWSRGFAATAPGVTPAGVAVGPTGELAIIGGLGGSVDFGGGPIASAGANDLLVAVLAP